jgi:hypothetical protein
MRIARSFLFLSAVSIIPFTQAWATPITWDFNATFVDGGVASGFFVYNADEPAVFFGLQPFTDWDITVSGGDTSTFFPFEFTPANSTAGFWVAQGSFFVFESDAAFPNPVVGLPPEPLLLRFFPSSPLTDSAGSTTIDPSNPYSVECFACSAYRVYSSGTLAAVPEPSPLALIGLGVLAIGGSFLRGRLARS